MFLTTERKHFTQAPQTAEEKAAAYDEFIERLTEYVTDIEKNGSTISAVALSNNAFWRLRFQFLPHK